MTRSGVQFWFVFLSGAALGVFVTLICTGHLKALVSWFDSLIGFDDLEPRQYRQHRHVRVYEGER